MIPGLLAHDVAQSLREFIVSGFETDTWPFAGKFDQLVNSSNNGEAFIKGPYVSINLPFAKNTDSRDFFSGFKTEYSPFIHQQAAWQNLQSDKSPKSTLVATGTGSGKTECFLYPLLDHCQRNNQPGIKAIVIYPMNALAGDQAKRFASVIHEIPSLKGNVRVGLFVGGAEVTDQKIMGPEQVITCKKTLRKSPPDILLTNYKMLDYLLMRPKDQDLWKHNNEDSLKYLVVDELHTFDGAQGSDLAMLIRRLKARLNVKTDKLICVGTSATLGSESQMGDLAEYASDIFDTQMTTNNIIGESRESQEQFLEMIEYMFLDPSFTPDELRPAFYDSLDDYLRAQIRLFFGLEVQLEPTLLSDREKLGRMLQRHILLHNILIKTRKGPVPLHELISAIQKQLPTSLKLDAQNVLISLLSLLAHARGVRYPNEPLVTLRLQLWVRELRRIVSRVGNDTAQYPVNLHFADDLKVDASELYLPVVQCNECHTTAWVTSIEQGESQIELDLRKIYTRFFSSDKQVRVLLPLKDAKERPPSKGTVKFLCVYCGNLQHSDDHCESCLEDVMVSVFEPDLNKSVRRGGVPTFESQRQCPVCQAKSSLILFGSRAASLSSVAIHQMFSNPINDDKKLIAFSDSVQDAAHRAGFFSARTWQNNIRMALAKTVTHYVKSEGKPVALVDLFNYLPRFFLENKENPEHLDALDYITQFIAPNMQSHEDYLSLQEDNTLLNPGNLLAQINKRFIWEILSEFGIRSLIGRSLERTGGATLTWNPSLIMIASNSLRQTCSEKLGHDLTEKQAEYMLWGIAIRMKRQGAIVNDLLFGYIVNGGDWYYLSRKNLSFMPDIGNYSILPRFPGEAAEKGLDRLLPDTSNWYSRWVLQLLGVDQLVDNNFVADLLKLVMSSLVDSGLALKFETKKEHDVWGLNPDALLITTDVSAVRLKRDAGTDILIDDESFYGSWYIDRQWQKYVVGLPSLDQIHYKDQQKASYDVDRFPKVSMFKNFYLDGEIQRVIAHEHTGLLERDYREAIEARFMAKPENRKGWYENLLSATPTLEMGIDIGDLSSVMLCSVPPSQANYLQRAGRSGRKDGNSFVMTLANGHPHDLYFYADPLKMMAGDVDAPAIFLNASMVLKRQLLAFCFDQWGVTSNGGQVIPGSMQPVLDAVENHDQNKFPYTILEFISKNRDDLWDEFQYLLGDKVTDSTKNKLKEYMLETSQHDDALHIYVLNRIQQVVLERKALVKHQRDLESELRALERRPQDESRDNQELELKTELEGIKRLKVTLNRKETLNFFTDDGLLPNYAFPEEGTTLHSVIYRRLSKPKEMTDGKTSNFDSKVFEYSRPAHSALTELAPESIFYASNRKVQIERVEMAKGENLEYWRMCPSCSFSQVIIGADTDSSCPRCHDLMWSNVSQKIPLVRLKQVYANTREDEALISDESDTREPTFFNRQMLIDFEPEDILLAYAMKTETKPFGFEFIKKANFKEINFGKQSEGDQVFNVAGVELSRPGFRLCKECGMVQHGKNKIKHLYKCQYRVIEPKEGDEQTDAGIIDCLYLYRQYESEAIRILMPRLSIATNDEQTQSFVAALQLGLKTRFGGKVDHLQITTSDEPIPGSQERANYLVIYDTVPGGTGYLHELLADPNNLMDLLRLSQDVMAKCSCQDIVGLDGCYNCLYAYRNSYGMEHTSRVTALSMLSDILDDNVELEKIEHLGKINKNVWADSELEVRFPDAIQALNQHADLGEKRIRITKDIIKGKVGFKLEIGGLIYSVELHPQFDDKDGVAYPCEPDFLFTLDRDSEEVPPVAVFLDGYKYHKNIVHEDLLKRQGIFLSTNMLTWSLTWHDVNHAFVGNEVKIPNVFLDNTEDSPKPFIRKISEQKGLLEHSRIAKLNPLLMLLKFLSSPNVDEWKSYAALRTLNWLDQRVMQDASVKDKMNSALSRLPSQYLDNFSSVDLIFQTINTVDDEAVRLSVFIAGGADAIKSLNTDDLILASIYQAVNPDTEISQRTWQKLLQIVNLGQFLPNFFAGTEDGIADGSFSKLTWGRKSTQVKSSEWDKIFNLVDDTEVRELLSFLSDRGVDIPEVGYELENNKGAAIAEAELAWENKKIVFLMEYQLEDSQQEFEKQGWLVMTIIMDKDVILNKLGGKN